MSYDQAGGSELIDRLQGWIGELRERALRPEAELVGLETVFAEFRRERLDIPSHSLLVVMLCGPTTAGKSSLINRLAGQEISRTGLGATTSEPVLYMHEKDNPDRLFEYGKEIGQLGRDAIVRHARNELLHKVLIDTPDIDSVMTTHRERTAALVHAADLVLFVTTPERYKDTHEAQWVNEQSAHRAMAFILNKWDRDSIGLQWEQRNLIEGDFRNILEVSGFAASKIFKISCLNTDETEFASEVKENQLDELRDWLGRGLNSSTSAAIQNRRRIMGLGRLSAAIAREIPEAVTLQPLLSAAEDTLGDAPRQVQPLVAAAAAELAADANDRSQWPSMPGLFGAYARLLNWWRTPSYWPGAQKAHAADAALAGDAGKLLSGQSFAGVLSQPLSEVARKLRYGLSRELPFKAVEIQWDNAISQLSSRLAVLPAATWAELTAKAAKVNLRRSAGIIILLCIEAAIVVTLALSLWRIGYGFASERYESSALLYNTAALIVVLILCGHIFANLAFPSLRHLFQTELIQSLQAAFGQTCSAMRSALSNHVAAIERLAAEGRKLQAMMDGTVETLRHASSMDMVENLFRRPENSAEIGARHQGSERRRARFE